MEEEREMCSRGDLAGMCLVEQLVLRINPA